MNEFKDLNELLVIARNINEGKYDVVDINIEPESELYEIAKYFSDSLNKLKTFSSGLEKTYDDLPAFEKTLSGIITDSKRASGDVLASVDKMNFNIDEIKENLEMAKHLIGTKDFARAEGLLNRISEYAAQGEEICFDIVAALEFQAETKENLNEMVKIINALEERLASILIKLGIKQNVIVAEDLDKIKDKKEILQDQDLVDRLLKEFGV